MLSAIIIPIPMPMRTTAAIVVVQRAMDLGAMCQTPEIRRIIAETTP